MIFLPDVHAGCVVEFSYRTRYILGTVMPEFSETLEIQGDSPALASQIQLRLPSNGKVRFRLRNSDAKPRESTAGPDRGSNSFGEVARHTVSIPPAPPVCSGYRR